MFRMAEMCRQWPESSLALCLVGAMGVACGADPPNIPPSPNRSAAGQTSRLPVAGRLLPAENPQEIKLSLDEVAPIDLTTSLALAGAENPHILVAMNRTLAATARQQLAAAQALPNINLGMNFDLHNGALQQASGNVLQVNRDAFYIGTGAQAVAAGSVSIPGIQYNLNVGESLFRYYEMQRRRDAAVHHVTAVRNQVLVGVANAYIDLVGTQALRSVAYQARTETQEAAQITAAYAKTGQGLPADAERAATELELREADLVRAEADVSVASARLAELLNLKQSQRLYAADNYLVPHPAVPELIPRAELLAIALIQRPELHEHQSLVHAALMDLYNARMLPFSPQVMFGYSDGMFGGGSNLVAGPTSVSGAAPNQARFSTLYGRSDLDVVAFWSLRNLGIGNKALIGAAQARWEREDFELLETMNRVRQEVVDAQIRTHAYYSQLHLRERAVQSSLKASREDMIRIRSNDGRPIETLNSLRLLRKARRDYVETIVNYNKAHVDLYVALGNPPVDMITRPASTDDLAVPLPAPK